LSEGDGEGYETTDEAAAAAAGEVAVVAGAVVSAHLCVESEVRGNVRCSRGKVSENVEIIDREILSLSYIT